MTGKPPAPPREYRRDRGPESEWGRRRMPVRHGPLPRHRRARRANPVPLRLLPPRDRRRQRRLGGVRQEGLRAAYRRGARLQLVTGNPLGLLRCLRQPRHLSPRHPPRPLRHHHRHTRQPRCLSADSGNLGRREDRVGDARSEAAAQAAE